MQDEIRHCHIAFSTCKCNIKITSAMLSIFGRAAAGAILLAVVDVSHDHALKAVQKHNTKHSWVSLCTLRVSV